jgi:aminobenzoyl-glutamate transport protein
VELKKTGLASDTQTQKMDGVLKWIETIGNKIPDPTLLFVYLIGLLIIISAALSAAHVSIVNPLSHKTVMVKSLLSKEAAHWFLTEMVRNFTSFPPLGVVLAITMGIGLVEKTGLLTASIKSLVYVIPKWCVTFALVMIAFLSHLASDVAFVIMPAVGAMVFYSAGRHPLAGISTAMAGVGAGFTANLLIATTDVLLAGISSEASKIVNPNVLVSPLDNWFFLSFSVLFLSIITTLITEKIVEPRLGVFTSNVAVKLEDVTVKEKKALRITGIVAALFIIVVALLVVPEGAFLRNSQTGLVMGSPFLRGIVPIILFFFIVTGVTYGIKSGSIQKGKDFSKLMGESIKSLSGFIVLVFFIAQFTAAFTWANMGEVLATAGADFLTNINMVGLPAVFCFMVVGGFCSIFIASGSAVWALLAPMFIPMFMYLGYHPAFIQLGFRIAMSVLIPINPLNPFISICIKVMSEYTNDADMGKYLSLMIPYSVAFLLIWPALFAIWYFLGLPIGPGVFPRL